MAGSAATRYAALEQDRQPYLDRGRQCAKLTIPSLLPDAGTTGSTVFTTPEQSLGARGLNNVSAKQLLALFPPNAPFFKMEVDEITAQDIAKQEGAKDEIDKAFAQFVRRVMTDVESRALRADLYEGIRMNTLTGNALLYIVEEGRCRVYRLDKYVIKRDPSGNLLEIVIKEAISQASIPAEVRAAIPAQTLEKVEAANGQQVKPTEKPFDLYTHVLLTEDGQYKVYQEIEGEIVPGSEGSYVKEELPFIAMRFNKVDGENYGRGLVEEYLGDLAYLEDLSKSVREFVAITSRVIPIVNPNGTITPKDLTGAKNGEPIYGNVEDVGFLQVERYNDFRVAKEMIDEVTNRLSYAFLLNSAIQRPGERVTAEEIRYMARELEDTLGGTYSVQSVDVQLPLASILIKHLERRGSLPELPKQVATPKVVTGMDALGRGNDLSNLIQFRDFVSATPESAATVNWLGFNTRVANSLNIEMTGLLKTPDEIAAEQEQARMAAMVQQLGPNAVTQMGGMAQKQMETPPA